jgi:hypothetical protein
VELKSNFRIFQSRSLSCAMQFNESLACVEVTMQ